MKKIYSLVMLAILAIITSCGGTDRHEVTYDSGDTDVYTFSNDVIKIELKNGGGIMETVEFKLTKEAIAGVEKTDAFALWKKENPKCSATDYIVRNFKRASIDVKQCCSYPATFRFGDGCGIVVDPDTKLLILCYTFYCKNSFGVEDRVMKYVYVDKYDQYRII